jgi:hypothetical protein
MVDYLGYVNFVLDIIVLLAIIWVALFLYPTEQKACNECNVKVLCQNKLLKGKVCDPYITVDYEKVNITI